MEMAEVVILHAKAARDCWRGWETQSEESRCTGHNSEELKIFQGGERRQKNKDDEGQKSIYILPSDRVQCGKEFQLYQRLEHEIRYLKRKILKWLSGSVKNCLGLVIEVVIECYFPKCVLWLTCTRRITCVVFKVQLYEPSPTTGPGQELLAKHKKKLLQVSNVVEVHTQEWDIQPLNWGKPHMSVVQDRHLS